MMTAATMQPCKRSGTGSGSHSEAITSSPDLGKLEVSSTTHKSKYNNSKGVDLTPAGHLSIRSSIQAQDLCNIITTSRSNMTRIKLSHGVIEGDDDALFTQALTSCQELTSLETFNWKFRNPNVSFKALGDALLQLPQLEELVLDFTSDDETAELAVLEYVLVPLLSKANNKLRKISFFNAHTKSGDADPPSPFQRRQHQEALSQLFKACQESTTLQSLTLHNRPGLQDLTDVAAMIQHNTSLQQLEVSVQHDLSLVPIAEALTHNFSLKDLTINAQVDVGTTTALPNFCSDEHVVTQYAAFCHCLKHYNTTLTHLFISLHSGFTSPHLIMEQKQHIQLYLMLNQRGRKLFFAEEPPQMKECLEALSKTHNPNILYYFLQTFPNYYFS